VPHDEHWSGLPEKRLLVTRFASGDRTEEFNMNWLEHEIFFMAQQRGASLLLACPAADTKILLEQVVEANEWVLVGSWDHDHPFAHGPLLQYRTSDEGIDVFFQPMHLPFPKHYNPSMNGSKPLAACAKRRFTWEYALYSGAVFAYQMIHLPILAKYDYFMKLDGDLVFRNYFPVDVGADMEEKGCIVGHAAIHRSGDCEARNLEALLAADQALGWPKPKSLAYNWCNVDGKGEKGDVVFFGNFQVYQTKGFLLSPQIQSISTYMYEEWVDGYFTHRWGDQGPFVMYVCQMLDLPDLEKDPRICSYAEHRESGLFVHGKGG